MLPLILLGGGALYLALRNKSSVPGNSGGSGQVPASLPVSTTNPPNPLSALASAGAVGGIIAGTAAAATAAYQGGQSLDLSINPNSNSASRSVAGIAAGVIVGTVGAIALVAVLAGGLLATLGPIGAILIAVAVLTYAVFIGVQDLVRLAYGQAGARKDYAAQLASITQQCQESVTIGAGANGQVVSQVQIDRQLVPFVEGWQTRLNWSAYQSWLQQKQVKVTGDVAAVIGELGIDRGPEIKAGRNLPGTAQALTSDLQWHVNFAIDRGYFVGDCDGARPIGSDVGAWGLTFPSLSWDWVKAHCPPSEIVADATNAIQAAAGVPLPASVPQKMASAPAGIPCTTYLQTNGKVPALGGGIVSGLVTYYILPPQGSSVAISQADAMAAVNRYTAGGLNAAPLSGGLYFFVPTGPTLQAASLPVQAAQNVLIGHDPRRPEFFAAGYAFGNFSIYKGIANGLTPKGDVKQLQAALAAGKFEGVVNSDGSLTYSGGTYHWNNAN